MCYYSFYCSRVINVLIWLCVSPALCAWMTLKGILLQTLSYSSQKKLLLSKTNYQNWIWMLYGTCTLLLPPATTENSVLFQKSTEISRKAGWCLQTVDRERFLCPRCYFTKWLMYELSWVKWDRSTSKTGCRNSRICISDEQQITASQRFIYLHIERQSAVLI